jgi:hypothetical protein
MDSKEVPFGARPGSAMKDIFSIFIVVIISSLFNEDLLMHFLQPTEGVCWQEKARGFLGMVSPGMRGWAGVSFALGGFWCSRGCADFGCLSHLSLMGIDLLKHRKEISDTFGSRKDRFDVQCPCLARSDSSTRSNAPVTTSPFDRVQLT